MTATLPPIANDAPPLTALRPLQPFHEKYTREGTCLYRKLPLTTFGSDQRFWAHWKAEQRAWLERGYSLGKDDQGWHVQQWLTKARTLTSVGAERLARLAGPAVEQIHMDLVEELNLVPLPAELEAKLFPYQIEPARQIFRAVTHGMAEWGYPGAVDFSQLGTGKSYMDLAAALATGRRVAVVCPPAGHAGWESVFAHFGAEPAFITSYEAIRGNWRQHITRERADGEFEWQDADNLIIIMDEIQAARHSENLTTRCIRGAIRQAIPIIAASATAAISPLELRFVGRLVGLHRGGDDWTRFLAQHGCSRTGNTWRWNKDRSTLAKVHGKLFPRRGCRVRTSDLGDMAPETIIEILSLDVPEAVEIDREWKEAQTLFSKLEAAGVHRGIIMGRQRAAYSAVWQKCDAALVGPVVEHARRQLDEGRSVAFFLNFTETRLRIGKTLGTTAGFYGGQSKKARKWFMEQFQQDKIHVLVSNIGAGGASVSLHDIAGKRPRTSYIFPSDHVIKVEQATGRVDRVGGQSVSRQYIPVIRGTLVEQMVRRTRRKMLGIGTLNDGTASSRI